MSGETRERTWRQATLGVAVVALLFVLFVLGQMWGAWRESVASRPLEHPELGELRAQLQRQPGSAPIQDAIRRSESELRARYMRAQERIASGSWLLLAAVVVFAGAARLAVRVRLRPSGPAPRGSGHDPDRPLTLWGRISVVVIALALGGTAFTLPGMLTETVELERAVGVWSGFRGPGSGGISPHDDVPLSFDARPGKERNLRWKSVVPLPGLSSPAIWNERVFLTGAIATTREVYCLDALTGAQLWRRSVSAGEASTEIPENIHGDTGFAAPTPVLDGEHLWAMFANGDVVCLDFFGKERWCVNLGVPDNMYGHAASPVLYEGSLLIQLDQEQDMEGYCSALIALDTATGAERWRIPREVDSSWPTPILIATEKGDQLVTCANPWVIAYDPRDGKELWRLESPEGDGGPSPVFGAGLVFAVNVSSPLVAIRPDGEGDVTETHLVWEYQEGLPDVCSPVCWGGLLFMLSTDGVATCLDAKSGELAWEQEIDAFFYASPALAAGRLYLISREGELFVLAAEREFRELGRGYLGEECDASPAFAAGRMYVRGKQHLFCFTEEEAP